MQEVLKIEHGISFSIRGLNLSPSAKTLIMKWVAPGKFQMGQPLMDEDGESFEVVLTEGFWLGQYLITQAQWRAVMYPDSMSYTNTENHPIVYISWENAMNFCAALNKKYAPILPKNYIFSLPTEAQWEYSCRAGTNTHYYNGERLEDLDDIAWHRENSNNTIHNVGEKNANQWGFYDMIGNTMELCFDELSIYPRGVVLNWIGSSDFRMTSYERNNGAKVRIIRSSAYSTPRSSKLAWCSGSQDPGIVMAEKSYPWISFRLCLRSGK